MPTVTVRATDSSGNVTTATDTYTVATTPPPSSDLTIIGMSSPKPDWATRLQQVGPTGITARRIFAWLGSDEQWDLVDYCVENNMMPVYSFKISDHAGALAGRQDAAVKRIGDRLKATGVDCTVTFHHEPNPDMSGADFVALNERFAPLLKSSKVKFGPFINGWLLDRQVPLFKSYTSTSLLTSGWDFLGIDTYESGTIDDPGTVKPADRIPKLVQFTKDNNVPTKPLGIGEYNGYSGATIRAAGEAILSTPQVFFGMMWNATTGKGYVLEGERLAAFKATKADPRVRK